VREFDNINFSDDIDYDLFDKSTFRKAVKHIMNKPLPMDPVQIDSINFKPPSIVSKHIKGYCNIFYDVSLQVDVQVLANMLPQVVMFYKQDRLDGEALVSLRCRRTDSEESGLDYDISVTQLYGSSSHKVLLFIKSAIQLRFLNLVPDRFDYGTVFDAHIYDANILVRILNINDTAESQTRLAEDIQVMQEVQGQIVKNMNGGYRLPTFDPLLNELFFFAFAKEGDLE
jgi:hypothetical protein